VPECGRTRRGLRGVLAWGRKPSAASAHQLATRMGLPVLHLEDGFLRSLGLGKSDPPLSIVVDDQGIYYDAHAPSRLEALVATPLTEGAVSAGASPGPALAGGPGVEIQPCARMAPATGRPARLLLSFPAP
jgi:hypothetical protein